MGRLQGNVSTERDGYFGNGLTIDDWFTEVAFPFAESVPQAQESSVRILFWKPACHASSTWNVRRAD